MSIKDLLKRLKLAESTISTVLGALVVIVIGLLLFNYFRGVGKQAKPSIPGEETQIELIEEGGEAPKPVEALPATYKVKPGDHLWKIAKSFYGSGYNWVDVAKENNLPNANLLAVAQELAIPDVPVRQPQKELPKTGTEEKEPIVDDTYTVVKGDNLWEIAVRAYGDGFKWTQIAETNDLANPNLIHPGNVLELPR